MIRLKTAKHLILDFTHVYQDEHVRGDAGISWIDCSDIPETDMYCSGAAYREIERRTEPFGICGVHFLDSGNYHYVSKIMVDRIREPFSLVLYDHHTDMQKPLVPGTLSCGDWAGQVLDANKYLRQLILVGPEQTAIDEARQEHTQNADKLLSFSEEALKTGAAREGLAQIDRGVPFYLSIDKDILNTGESETNWNQGDMPLAVLEELLRFFLAHDRILGIDICGECRKDLPLFPYLEAERKNERTNRELFTFITDLMRRAGKNS